MNALRLLLRVVYVADFVCHYPWPTLTTRTATLCSIFMTSLWRFTGTYWREDRGDLQVCATPVYSCRMTFKFCTHFSKLEFRRILTDFSWFLWNLVWIYYYRFLSGVCFNVPVWSVSPQQTLDQAYYYLSIHPSTEPPNFGVTGLLERTQLLLNEGGVHQKRSASLLQYHTHCHMLTYRCN